MNLATSWGGLQVSMQAMVRCVAARSFWLAQLFTGASLWVVMPLQMVTGPLTKQARLA